MAKDETDLTFEDITFLQAIQEINETPEDYPEGHTDKGRVPATTTAIRGATDLSKGQIDYRFDVGSSGRGFGQSGMGLIRIYDPPLLGDGSYGPKSGELTDKGERRLEAALDSHGMSPEIGAQASPKELARLEERVEELERTVEQLRSQVEPIEGEVAEIADRVDAWEGDEFGAVDPETASRLRTVLSTSPLFNVALAQVLGVPMGTLQDSGGDLSEAEKEEMQRAVAATLGMSAGAPAGGGGVDSPEQ